MIGSKDTTGSGEPLKCSIFLVTNTRAVVLKAFTVPGLGDIRQESYTVQTVLFAIANKSIG